MLPVGSILEFDTPDVNPIDLYGGDWEYYGEGRVTVGYDSNDTDFNWVYDPSTEKYNVGGEKQHKLTIEEMPIHDHHTPNGMIMWASTPSMSVGIGSVPAKLNDFVHVSTSGGDTPHNNMPPYTVVYRWHRIA